MVGPASTRRIVGASPRQAEAAGYLGQHLGQLAGELDSGGAASTDHHGRQTTLPLAVGGRCRSCERCADGCPHPFGVTCRVQGQCALGQTGDGEIVGSAAKRQYKALPADWPSLGQNPPTGEVETNDLCLHEASFRGQHVPNRYPYRVSRAGAACDPRQLGQRLVVVVPVDERELRLAAAHRGRHAQGNVQTGVACSRDHDLTAQTCGGFIHCTPYTPSARLSLRSTLDQPRNGDTPRSSGLARRSGQLHQTSQP